MAPVAEEKHGFESLQTPRLRRSYSLQRVVAILILSCMTVTAGLQWHRRFQTVAGPSVNHPKADKAFRWEDVTPSKTLEYHPCFSKFQCARLEVPLDWNETSSGESGTVAIAIIKKPARVEVTDSRYGGVIMFNPGGPGGSGVAAALGFGEPLQTIVDSAGPGEEKYFDVLSWDPRGVANTTPGHGCIANPVARQIWTSQDEAIGFYLQDPEVFSNVFTRRRTFGQMCASTDDITNLNKVNGNEHIAQYMSTANVVRDMVEIIERHGEWRSKRAVSLLSCPSPCKRNASAILARTAYSPGSEKLQYAGISYGTFLGQTFASMQPHRVHRMVLDGVVDANDYARTEWLTNIQDIDRITALFASECYAAGPIRCSFHSTSPAAITSKLHKLLSAIQESPLPVLYNGVPYTITHTDITTLLFDLWYNPAFGFSVAANVLNQIAHGNGTFLASFKSGALLNPCRASFAKEYEPPAATIAILCTDAEPWKNTTAAGFQSHVDKLRSQSELFANRWSLIPLHCTSFSKIIRAKWRFEGPFGANTSYPILFLSQTLDPVTPLRNAVAATNLFPGSVVLETRGAGHCTLSMPSIAGLLAVRKYFGMGDVPANGTQYEVDTGYFGGGDVVGNGTVGRKGWEEEVREEVLEAGKKIAEAWPIWGKALR